MSNATSTPPAPASFTGRRRDRRTRWTVKWGDRIARGVITVGGIGTIVAVVFVCYFLIRVAFPLFSSAHWQAQQQRPIARPEEAPLALGGDEYQAAIWTLDRDGSIQVHALRDGSLVEERALLEGEKLSAAVVNSDGGAAFALGDGSVRTGRIKIASEHLAKEKAPESVRGAPLGIPQAYEKSLYTLLPSGDFRVQRLQVQLEEPLVWPGASDSPVRCLDLVESISKDQTKRHLAGSRADGAAFLVMQQLKVSPIDGSIRPKITGAELPPDERQAGRQPRQIFLSGLGTNVWLLYDDGQLLRYDSRQLKNCQLAERVDLVPEESGHVTAATWLLGRATLCVADSTKRLRLWFLTRPDDAETNDQAALTLGHEFHVAEPLTALSPSVTSRTLGAGDATGHLSVFQATTERLLLRSAESLPGAVTAVSMSPKGDGVVALAGKELAWAEFDLRHHEATFQTLFRPVFYEGANAPVHSWQSSGGTNEEEPKYGLAPLVFGTLKATFYSMLLACPLALLAAVFTSEFLGPTARARIKPGIELMASLPSVVLGYLAANILAPLAENRVPTILTALATVPFCLLLAAHLWQLLPNELSVRFSRFRIWLCLLALPVGVWVAVRSGPLVELWLFGGDLKGWSSEQIGTGLGAWMMLLLPVSAIGTALLAKRLNDWDRKWTGNLSRSQLAALQLVKMLAGTMVAISVAWGLGQALTTIGWDPRGTFVGPYDQRNALIVGMMMGFAVIPIIYTLADDALSSVPQHLRSASLGAGATPWQTAMRIVVPTAMSGLFSAVMVGLGRAVGETMIVLMAAGNTPLMDWNVFNGFRTLSANIAVELGEAVENGTHYRILFLAALVLFAMTFLVNTVAELVRQRFRRRAYEL